MRSRTSTFNYETSSAFVKESLTPELTTTTDSREQLSVESNHHFAFHVPTSSHSELYVRWEQSVFLQCQALRVYRALCNYPGMISFLTVPNRKLWYRLSLWYTVSGALYRNCGDEITSLDAGKAATETHTSALPTHGLSHLWKYNNQHKPQLRRIGPCP